jgi:coatomer protein complex subunit alpha (xenin)
MELPETDTKKKNATEEHTRGGWGDDDFDIPEGLSTSDFGADIDTHKSSSEDYFVMPTSGKSAVQKWSSTSQLAADLIACGQFDLAMHMLNRQLGIVNFAPLKEYFLTITNSACIRLPLLPGDAALPIYLRRASEREGVDQPDIVFKLSQLSELRKTSYELVTKGEFRKALREFTQILLTIPFIVVDKRGLAPELTDLINSCREYITAIRLELKRKETTDPIQQCALAAYFTHCKLQPIHTALGLRSAIKISSQQTVKNYIMCAGFCRRALELAVTNPAIEKLVDPKKIRAFLQLSEKANVDECKIDYNEDNFQLCMKSFTTIPRGKPSVKCPFCSSTFHQQYDQTLCSTCGVAKIGADASGLKCFSE